MIPGISQIRWLIGYFGAAFAGAWFMVRLFEALAEDFLALPSTVRRKLSSSSERGRRSPSSRE